MEEVVLTGSHWLFLLVIGTIFTFMIFRRDVVLPSILGIFLIGWMFNTGNGIVDTSIGASQAVFTSFLNAGIELFDIMLVIALMVAMLKSLQKQGADVLMVSPMKKLMVNPTASFFVLGSTMYIAATFFWPTPAVALVGTVLIPVAMKMGLPAMGAAVSLNLFGHGMALSGDLVIQGATRLTSAAAGVESTAILPYTALFSFITGFVAIGIAFFTIRRDMKSGKLKSENTDEFFDNQKKALTSKKDDSENEEIAATVEAEEPKGKHARFLSLLVPITLLTIVSIMLIRSFGDSDNAINGGDATALLGGTAVVLLIISTLLSEGNKAIEGIVSHLREGFYFAIKIFAPVIPIAAFFLMGHPDHAAAVLGEGAPGFLFDLGGAAAHYIDGSQISLAFGMVAIAILSGMDGSGFSGLPLVGALSAGLGDAVGVDVAVLAALGQVATIFAGGGTLAAWAFGVVADAGIAGVKPIDLVRRNFFPVMIGLFIATIVAILLM
ncbi:hypothetical protein [Desertibacillus haloalkaliphilus]|uniref:hypothetical protein n=1 Tax=Desertibacillus haloalkaliphilus TaxID=1328930 RepID=UPI001C2615F4|nr:hypothetical protein [Desertibacillus haloalkaliphilus]MBU8908238.1 hypothetical protein [Desertibacillus haloalkaliphilus]